MTNFNQPTGDVSVDYCWSYLKWLAGEQGERPSGLDFPELRPGEVDQLEKLVEEAVLMAYAPEGELLGERPNPADFGIDQGVGRAMQDEIDRLLRKAFDRRG